MKKFKLHITVCGFVSGCEALACVVGQLAQNRCYTLARLIKR